MAASIFTKNSRSWACAAMRRLRRQPAQRRSWLENTCSRKADGHGLISCYDRKCHPTIAGMWLITALLLLAMSPPAIADAEGDDHLEPCKVIFAQYENRVESISLAAMPGEVEFWVTVIPSFQPEWSVGVSSEKGRYFVTHVFFQRSLWGRRLVQSGPTNSSYDFSKSRVRTTARTAIISAELHRALRSEWARSIEGARPADPDPNGLERIVLDGATFTFKVSERCGSAELPDPETRNDQLVDLVVALSLLANSKGDTLRAAGEGVERMLQKLAPR
jgi:hypothetical protein